MFYWSLEFDMLRLCVPRQLGPTVVIGAGIHTGLQHPELNRSLTSAAKLGQKNKYIAPVCVQFSDHSVADAAVLNHFGFFKRQRPNVRYSLFSQRVQSQGCQEA